MNEPKAAAYRSPRARHLYCVTCARQETDCLPVTEADEQALCSFCGSQVHAVASRTLADVVANYIAQQEQSFEVAAYRGKRNWYLKIADYRQTVSDGPGKPPAREQAEALRRDLLERSHRNRFGWTHIDIQPKTEGAS